MQETLTATPLDDLGALRIQGPDVVKFLQGQLSNDVTKLGAGKPLLAGLHNPQGRVIALLRLISLASDDMLAILPRELAASVAARLGKYVLRAKVKITDESVGWRVTGLVGQPPADSLAIPIDTAGPRWWLIEPADTPSAAAGYASLDREAWRALDIAAGLPQVYAGTSEEFVAQMLNLDVLGAIAFDKGCYTGQEIIARAHYRGRVKRRMQRFRVEEAAAPGSNAALKIVEGVALANGIREILAVTELDSAAAAQKLPLPYTLPD